MLFKGGNSKKKQYSLLEIDGSVQVVLIFNIFLVLKAFKIMKSYIIFIIRK